MPENQGPQGAPAKPVNLAFLNAPSAPATAAPQPAHQPAPPPQSIVDSEGYAQAINACLQAHPELAEMASKFFAIAGAVKNGHDVQEAVIALSTVAAQTVGVLAVKFQEVPSDPDAIAAIEELDEVLDEIEEVVNKETMSKSTKDKILGLVARGRAVAGDFLEDDEDDEEDEGA